MQAGTIAFADTSRPLPRSFTDLTVFTKDVAEDVCGIDRTLHKLHLRSRASVRYLDVDASARPVDR